MNTPPKEPGGLPPPSPPPKPRRSFWDVLLVIIVTGLVISGLAVVAIYVWLAWSADGLMGNK